MHRQTNPIQPEATPTTEASTFYPLADFSLAIRGTRRRLTTDEFAAGLGLAAQSIRKRLCQTGSYFGIVPLKLPNGRLMWPANALEALMDGAGGQ